jgi:hypothetical protein
MAMLDEHGASCSISAAHGIQWGGSERLEDGYSKGYEASYNDPLETSSKRDQAETQGASAPYKKWTPDESLYA